jgi:hypothetical protein
MVMDKIYREEKLDLEEYKFLVRVILDNPLISLSTDGNNYFPPKTLVMEEIWNDFKKTIYNYRVGESHEIGYKIRVRDINAFRNKCVEFIKRMFELYSGMLSAEELTELSKDLERKAFEKT